MQPEEFVVIVYIVRKYGRIMFYMKKFIKNCYFNFKKDKEQS